MDLIAMRHVDFVLREKHVTQKTAYVPMGVPKDIREHFAKQVKQLMILHIIMRRLMVKNLVIIKIMKYGAQMVGQILKES